MFIRNVTNSCVPFYSKSRERIFICHKCHLSHLPVFSHLCFLIVYIHFWILRISYFTGIDHTPTNTLDENIFKDTNLGIQILLNENPYGFTDDFHLLKIFSSNMLVSRAGTPKTVFHWGEIFKNPPSLPKQTLKLTDSHWIF